MLIRNVLQVMGSRGVVYQIMPSDGNIQAVEHVIVSVRAVDGILSHCMIPCTLRIIVKKFTLLCVLCLFVLVGCGATDSAELEQAALVPQVEPTAVVVESDTALEAVAATPVPASPTPLPEPVIEVGEVVDDASEDVADNAAPTPLPTATDELTIDIVEEETAMPIEPTDEPKPTSTPPSAEAGASTVSDPVAPSGSVNFSEITPTTPDPNAEPQEMPEPGRPDMLPPEVQPIANAIITDVSQRTGSAFDAQQVTHVKRMSWNDSSLGCPQPDMMYAMLITEGFQVIVTVDGQELIYHTDMGGNFVYCEGAQKLE